MKLERDGDRWVWHGGFETRALPKGAGFRWDPANKQWWTDKQARAAQLAKYADDTCREELGQQAAQADRARELSRAASAEIDVPAPEGWAYLPFQKAGIAFAMDRPATLIADEMGLGKSVEALGVINADPSIHKVLIVCPASLKLNWQREAERWLVRPMRIGIANDYWPSNAGMVIVNYDRLKKYEAQTKAVEWDLIVIDEAHYLKNKKAQRSKLGYALKGKRRLMLTGTPIVNRPVELLPLIEYLGGDVMDRLGGGWRYLKRYCNGFRTRWGWDFTGAAHLDELQDILRETVMVRRLKKDVLTELPAKRRQLIELEPNGASDAVSAEVKAVRAHEGRMEDLQVAVELAKASDDGGEYRAAVEALRAQASAMFSEISILRHRTAMAKVPYVIEHLRDAIEEGKTVCFAHHKDVIAAIADEFGLRCVTLTGDTSMQDRQAAVDRFQADPDCDLFIGSITAAGVGITLTASSHVIFAELDWVPGNMSQAEDRCHRIGQTDSVLVQHLVLEHSIDARLAKVLIAKQEVIDQALDAERSELMQEPVVPDEPAASQSASRQKIAKEGAMLSATSVRVVHEALQTLAGMCDGARKLDGSGFNRLDSAIGKSLAAHSTLTPKQAALGLRIVLRYRKTQLSHLKAGLEAAMQERRDA